MRAIMFFALLLLTFPGITQGQWQLLAPGMNLGTFSASRPSSSGDSLITVLRIDPALWSLEFVGLSLNDEWGGRTAKQWSKAHHLTAAINAGMYGTDHRTHVGYLRFREHLNNDNVNAYKSVAAFDPRRDGLPQFRIFDLDSPGVSMETILQDYTSLVQNLRLNRKGIFTVNQLSFTFRPRRRIKRRAAKLEKYHHSLKARQASPVFGRLENNYLIIF